MTPEQLKWTDEQWAAHLGCAAVDVAKHKKWLTENYIPYIAKTKNTQEYVTVISRRNDAPSGQTRFVDMIAKSTNSKDKNIALAFANEKFIPSLELMPTFARLYGVPYKILQMLHINENQK